MEKELKYINRCLLLLKQVLFLFILGIVLIGSNSHACCCEEKSKHMTCNIKYLPRTERAKKDVKLFIRIINKIFTQIINSGNHAS